MFNASMRSFRIRLYEEHLEEASFLYEQRRALLTRTQGDWTELAAVEPRLEAHLDALVLGEALALEVCSRRAIEGDSGELFAAVCLICRHEEASLLAQVLRTLEPENGPRSSALADALKYELPDAWTQLCLNALGHGRPEIAGILAEVIAYRRITMQPELVRAVVTGGKAHQSQLLALLASQGDDAARELIGELLASRALAPQTAAQVVRARLRLHDRQALRHLGESGTDDLALVFECSLAGGKSMVAKLVGLLHLPEPRAATALGILGDLSAVHYLIDALEVEALGMAAAQALYMITGAPLFEEAFIAEPIDESVLFERELQAYRASGARPQRADGRPFGDSQVRLSMQPEVWQKWLQDNASRFNAQYRYRCGLPYTPQVALQALASRVFSNDCRMLMADELLIRHGIDLQFQPDLPVRRQLACLEKAFLDLQRTEHQPKPGSWYLFGESLAQ